MFFSVSIPASPPDALLFHFRNRKPEGPGPRPRGLADRRLEDGTLRFDRLGAGSYRIQVRDREDRGRAEQAVELGSDMEVVVEVSPR